MVDISMMSHQLGHGVSHDASGHVAQVEAGWLGGGDFESRLSHMTTHVNQQ